MRKIKKTAWTEPVILSVKKQEKGENNFPVGHYSYSFFEKMSTNPFMAKVNYINGEYLDTTSSPAGVLGKALHKAMQTYLGGNKDVATPANEGEAIELAHGVGLKFLNDYPDGFIGYNTVIKNRQSLMERYAFAFFQYIKESNYQKEAKEILFVEKKLEHRVSVDGRELPIPLKGYPDLVYRDFQGRICIDDPKFVGSYSPEEAIDGGKLLQAIFLFFLVAAETGEIPHRIRFREMKIVPNQDKSPQVKEFEMVYSEMPLAFAFFYRFYEDVTDALMGKAVFLPNIKAMWDKEVSILAYIHRLDIDEIRAQKFKDAQVDNITEFLKKKLVSDGSMKRYLETVATKFISAKTMNYKDKTIEDRIKMKLAEHGMGVEFDSKIVGGSVTLYRYEPSIGIKMSKIGAYSKDIEQVIGTSGIRILAPIPHSDLIGFEIPNKDRSFPALPVQNTGFEMAIGQTIMGEVKRFDIREAPHTLIAGATGAGKSVLLSSIIIQLNRLTKKQVEIHLYDPKRVELAVHKGDKNVVEYHAEPTKIQKSLTAMVEVMKERYKILEKAKVRNIETYTGEMPYKFLIIDEFGDLVLSTANGFFEWEFCKKHVKDSKELNYLLTTKKSLRKHETEAIEVVIQCDECKRHVYPPMSEIILKLAQMGRACGIHLIISTQRPSVDIITGSIKANFPTKIALRTSKVIDSNIILDQEGAEKLLGKGDMLFSSVDGVERLQGYLV